LNNNEDIMLAKGRGCENCRFTGYRGRTGIYEILEINEDIRRLIIARASSGEIREVALKKGMKSLGETGRELILQGISTLEEVQRMVFLGEEK